MSKNYKARIPRQKRGIETKNHIMKVAIKLFSRKGYQKTSSNEVAKSAKIPIGSFYAYFKDKRQLFLEAIQEYKRLVSEKIWEEIASLPTMDSEKNIEYLIHKLIDAHKILPNFHREIEVMRLYDPEINELMADNQIDAGKLVMQILEINKHRIKTDNLIVASLIISGALENVVHTASLLNDEVEIEHYVKELSKMLMKYLFK